MQIAIEPNSLQHPSNLVRVMLFFTGESLAAKSDGSDLMAYMYVNTLYAMKEFC